MDIRRQAASQGCGREGAAAALEGCTGSVLVSELLASLFLPQQRVAGLMSVLQVLFTENLVHGSDSLESATREIGIFFPNL